MLTICIGKVDVDFEKLDRVIRRQIPSGLNVNGRDCVGDRRDYKACYCDPRDCIAKFTSKEHEYFDKSLSSLGGGNHFVELDKDGDGNVYLIIHCGSRNFGKKVCEWWQNVAAEKLKEKAADFTDAELEEVCNEICNAR